MKSVNVIGAGLAGSEAAWQIAQAGVPVSLYEMRPKKSTEAHHSANFAELLQFTAEILSTSNRRTKCHFFHPSI